MIENQADTKFLFGFNGYVLILSVCGQNGLEPYILEYSFYVTR